MKNRVWIGQWIDSLTDAERDRIIQHPDPTYDGDRWWSFDRDCGCLVGCIVGKKNHGHPSHVFIDFYSPTCQQWLMVGCRFPQLTSRFGPERVWRVCKARAAKRNRVEAPAPAEGAV